MKKTFSVNKIVLENQSNSCKVAFRYFPSGIGHTVGNLMRRMSLKAFISLNVVAISMEGMSSIWSNVRGIKEDVFTMIENITTKLNLPINAIGENDTLFGIIHTPIGECTIRNLTLYRDSELTQLYSTTFSQTDTHLFTATEEITMKLYFKLVPSGYALDTESHDLYAKELSKYDNNLVFLPINSAPNLQFYYEVDTLPDSESDSIEELIITLENDGMIPPLQQMDLIIEKGQECMNNIQTVYSMNSVENATFHSIDLAELKNNKTLSFRTYNTLSANGIEYLEQLQQFTLQQVKKFDKLGEKSLQQIQSIMKIYHLKFKNHVGESDEESSEETNDTDNI